MPEVDLRKNYIASALPRNEGVLELELYRLLTIFSGSERISHLRGEDDHELTVYGRILRDFEYPEVTRIMLGIASVLRREWDSHPAAFDSAAMRATPVGSLIKDLAHPQAIDLPIRESFNKIIHANTINLDRSDTMTLFSGHLNPQVHLYGEFQRKQWRATINIYPWCENIHILT